MTLIQAKHPLFSRNSEKKSLFFNALVEQFSHAKRPHCTQGQPGANRAGVMTGQKEI